MPAHAGSRTQYGILLPPAFLCTGQRLVRLVSGILEGEETINQAGERILKEVLEVAGGKVTKAEALGFSDIAVDHVCRYI